MCAWAKRSQMLCMLSRKKKDEKKKKCDPQAKLAPPLFQLAGQPGRVMRVEIFLQVENVNPSRQKL